MRMTNMKKGIDTAPCNSSSNRTFPFDLPLLPLSSPSSTNLRTIQPRRERKGRSLQFMLHRRSQSNGISSGTTQRYPPIKKDDRSTMSLCSITSDEFEHEDTSMDSFDDEIELNSGYSIRSESSSLPFFPSEFDGNSMHASATVTPPTPARLVLKMRPSSFPLPFMNDNDLYDSYDMTDNGGYIQGEDESVLVGDHPSWTNNMYLFSPTVVHEDTDRAVISESVSYDDDDNENENVIPPPTTPPSWYNNERATNASLLLSPPPMIRLEPKRVIYLPFHDNSNIIRDHNESRSSSSTFNNYNSLQHLLLPNDF